MRRYSHAVPAARLTIVSDTHFSLSAPETDHNWEAVVRHVERTMPDLVIHVGDLSLDGANNANDLLYARRQLDRLAVEWCVVPGNHDVGENRSGDAPAEATNAERNRRWLEIIGADHWLIEVHDWAIVGINAQLLGSGLDAEDEQDHWMRDTFATLDREVSVALVSHKPFTGSPADFTESASFQFVPEAPRDRLLVIANERRLRLLISGHVHQYRTLDVGEVRHLWAPTTWAVLPDDVHSTVGLKRCGIVTLELDGARVPSPELVEPEGLVQLVALHDIPDRYSHVG